MVKFNDLPVVRPTQESDIPLVWFGKHFETNKSNNPIYESAGPQLH